MTISIELPIRLFVISDNENRIDQLKSNAENNLLADIRETKIEYAFGEITESNLPILLLLETLKPTDMHYEFLKKIQHFCIPSKIMVVGVFEASYLSVYKKFIQSGFFDYAVMPVSAENMSARLSLAKKRLLREEQFSEMGRLDALTGVLTRQGFLERARSLYASAKRKQISTAILMLSVDRLKGINMRFGQTTGDKVLIGFADILSKRKRDTDLLCRYSDNSFCMMTVNMRLSHLETFLDDIVLACLSPKYNAGLITLHVNASIGLTTNLGRSFDDMLNKAGNALRQSKERGPNEVTIDTDNISESVLVRSSIP
ncbi:hypothetical protein A9Q83_08275 [Alphaproteobacteria bacterium 46_93_T64]|nr:hypothetical protein A9Q83_08275 [Alphaproteobacteria bacterium 46_93_T64]